MKQLMQANDAPSLKFAELFITKGNRRYSVLNAKSFTATATVTTTDVPRLGSVITGKKATGLEVKLSMTVYKVSPMFDEIVEEFKNGGSLPTFECQVTSEDQATTIGRDTKVYKECILDGDVLLSAFDADGELIEQTIEAYAMDWDTAEAYSEPTYM